MSPVHLVNSVLGQARAAVAVASVAAFFGCEPGVVSDERDREVDAHVDALGDIQSGRSAEAGVAASVGQPVLDGGRAASMPLVVARDSDEVPWTVGQSDAAIDGAFDTIRAGASTDAEAGATTPSGENESPSVRSDTLTSTSSPPTVTSSTTAESETSSAATSTGSSSAASTHTATSSSSQANTSDYAPFLDGPVAGNPVGSCVVPEEAQLEDVSSPDRVVGTGSPSSCDADAFIDAVSQGGVITFDCGPEPVVITLDRPAKVFNNANPVVTIDGAGLVTLSGGGKTRILYMNTCDEAQVWTTSNCENQDHPRLTVQNLTFIDGNSKVEKEFAGGGAIYASGGRFKVINSRFFNNVCADDGPDVGGAGIRVLQQYKSLPAYVVNSTFGGAPELGNSCSNGGGISSIGVSWTVLNSVLSYNHAVGFGGNPPDPDTLGGGSGGAIYNDGATMTLTLCGSLLEHNEVNMYGSSIFFVSNNHDGSIVISSTTSRNNTGGGWDALLPGISMHEDTYVSVDEASLIE